LCRDLAPASYHPAPAMGRRKPRDHLLDGLPNKERPPRTKYGLEPMTAFELPAPRDDLEDGLHNTVRQEGLEPIVSEPMDVRPTPDLINAGPTADRPSATGPATGPAHPSSPVLSPMHFNAWHVGQFAYEAGSGDVACLICHVIFSRGSEASHGTGRRHAQESARQSPPEVPFCPGRAGAWGCHSFCRCGRFWPRGAGERPHLHFRVPGRVSQPDYDDDWGAGDSFEQGHRKVQGGAAQ
jgi:hypothetical protein